MSVHLDTSILANIQAAVGSTIAIPEALELVVPSALETFEKRSAKGDHVDAESLIMEGLRDLWATAHKANVKPEDFRHYCREQLAKQGDGLLARILGRKKAAQQTVDEANALEQEGLQARAALSGALATKDRLEHELAKLEAQVSDYRAGAVEDSIKKAAALFEKHHLTVRDTCQYRGFLRHAAYAEVTARMLQLVISDKKAAIAANEQAITDLRKRVKSIGK